MMMMMMATTVFVGEKAVEAHEPACIFANFECFTIVVKMQAGSVRQQTKTLLSSLSLV